MHATKLEVLHRLTDRLTCIVSDPLAVTIKWVGLRQTECLNARRRVSIGNGLTSWQCDRVEERARIGSQIFWLVRPIAGEQQHVQPSRDGVAVEVQGGKAVGRVPTTAMFACERRINGVGMADW